MMGQLTVEGRFHLASGLAGAAILLLHVPFLVRGPAAARFMERFPRHRQASWALTALDLVWVALLLYGMSWDRFDVWKPALLAAAPLAYAVVVYAIEEMLAARALGGLLLLAATPLLAASRWYPEWTRMVTILTAYAWVVAGTVLVLSPYRMRDLGTALRTHARRRDAYGAAGTALGVLLVILAFV